MGALFANEMHKEIAGHEMPSPNVGCYDFTMARQESPCPFQIGAQKKPEEQKAPLTMMPEFSMGLQRPVYSAAGASVGAWVA